MTIRASFTFENVSYVFSRSLFSLDRNYDDESYAYFLESIPNASNGIFEINILKNKENSGKLIEEGYASIYSSSDQVMPDLIVDTVIKFDYSNR